MAISRKPQSSKKQEDKVDVEALISKGGSVAKTGNTDKAKKKEIAIVNLRIPNDLLSKIDEAVDQRIINIPRHTWLMEAIVEKLQRDQ